MTDAVASSGTGAFAGIADGDSPKIGAAAGKAGAKHASAGKLKAVQAMQDPNARETAAGHSAQGAHKSGKAAALIDAADATADDTETSFEATIDSIEQPVQAVADNTPQLPRWNAELAGHIPFVRFADTVSKNTADTESAPAIQSSLPSTKSLKQESIEALMAAKDRLLAGDVPPDTNASTTAPASEEFDMATATPITVRSRETHWSFGAIPTQTVQNGAATRDDSPTAVKTLAIADSTGLTKTDNRAKAEAADKTATVQVQTAAFAVVGDNSAGRSFGAAQGDGSGARDRAADNGAAKRAAVEVAPAQPVESATADMTANTQAIPQSPTQQVRNSILDTLTNGAAQQAPATNAAMQQPDRPMVPGQVLRTIEVTLAPPDLGSVHLRMSLKSNSLSIEAEATKASTAKMLNDDRSTLEQNLRDAGYDLQALKITDAAAGSAANSNSSLAGGSQYQDGGQARSNNFAQRQDGDMQRRDGATPDQQQRPRGNNSQASAASDKSNSRQSDAIYI